ncbi:MAG: hypothetical protein JWM89_3974 [Acidimicrobiales bacterium]|nr:hypothetical protein [Acidimicrobiales bacterium]
MRGHVVPAAWVARLRPEDRRVGVALADADRLARCLRCDVWLEVSPPEPGAGVADVLPPLSDLPKPRRGKVLQEAVLLRLIALNKAAHSIVFGLLAIALAVLEFKLPGLQRSARLLDRRLAATVAQTGQEASRDRVGDTLHRVIGLHRSAVLVLLVTAAAYCIVEGIEAVGLWRERRWAEYLTALATAGLLPLEIHELIDRITVLRVGALVVNVAILVWLVRAKHLFGARGGSKTLHEQVDWAAILDEPAPAPHQ